VLHPLAAAITVGIIWSNLGVMSDNGHGFGWRTRNRLSRGEICSVGRMIFALVLRAALRGGVRGAGVARAEGVPQHAGVRQRRVRPAAVVGGPAVPLPVLCRGGWRPPRPRPADGDGGGDGGRGGGGLEGGAARGGEGGAVGEAAGALLVDEEGVHPEVEQFVTVDVPRPLADIKYVEQLDLADELYLDVPDDEERLRQLDVDPAVRPPHRVHVRHEGPHAGLPHLELNEPLLLPPAQLREGVDDDAGEVHLDGVVLQRVADHRGVVVHVPPLRGDRHTLRV